MKAAWIAVLPVVAGWMMLSATAQALELCEAQSKALMRSVGISEAQIERLCEKAERAKALLALDVVRREDALGYCRVTLSLTNNSTEHLNSLVVSTVRSRFDLFRFSDVIPGGTGYASANSRILLACDELDEIKLSFHWPVSLRIGGRVPSGRILQYYKPYLLNPVMEWGR